MEESQFQQVLSNDFLPAVDNRGADRINRGLKSRKMFREYVIHACMGR